MLPKVNDFFARDFVVGFFLPALMFALASVGLEQLFNPDTPLRTDAFVKGDSDFVSALLALFGVWMLAVLLMVLNRRLTRFLEGYSVLKYTFLQKRQEKLFQKALDRYTAAEAQVEAAKEQQEQTGAQIPRELVEEYRLAILDLRNNYPDQKRFVLATSFGNVMRAFEVYSRLVYGMDSIPVWPRILPLVPKEYREMVANERAEIDFAVNLFYLGLVCAAEYAGYAVYYGTLPMPWIPLACLGVTALAYWLAVVSARAWGDYVKSIFDMYRLDLLEQLGITPPATWDEEREIWENVSRTMMYSFKPKFPRTVPDDTVKIEGDGTQ